MLGREEVGEYLREMEKGENCGFMYHIKEESIFNKQ